MAYSPAGNNSASAGMAHLANVYYRKKGLDRLQKKFVFRDATMKDMLPKQVGRSVQFFRYVNFGTNTTPTTEGVVGTSLSMTSHVVGATVSQYTAFITVSDLLQDTAIDPIVQNASELLGYSAGLSVDTITRNVIDAEFTNNTTALLGTFTRVADVRNGRHQLQANDVLPFEDGEFFVVAHPFTTYDIVNDPAAGGLADIFKYTQPEKQPLVKYEDRGLVTHVAGARIIESTNVKKTAGSPNKYRMYMFGRNGIGSLDLEGRGPSDIHDPTKQRFKITVVKGEPSIADPEGVIGAAVSYNFVFTAVVLEGPAGIGGNYRFLMWDTVSSIG